VYKKWCHHCKSRTHNAKECRKKNQETPEAAKIIRDQQGQGSFAFKVSPRQSLQVHHYLKASLLLDCGATTHIVNDKSNFTNFDERFNPEVHFIELADGTRRNNIALNRGDAKVQAASENGAFNIQKKGRLYYLYSVK
jgi:hypothetical protein